ncbi:MAG: hypothetical protein COB24_11985 [Hyphomicrobiales bacterium]|nr:MAG: hypothetical protein COB24_11985 [Hyphomicrobiales bacterium]
MIGVDAETGKAITGKAHLRQSISRILFTPLGSVIMRPDFGSRLFELIGKNLDDYLQLEIFVATAEALEKWEPRILVKRVQFERSDLGVAILTLHYENVETGELVAETFEKEVKQ